MYPFSRTVTPALRSHIEAQNAFLNDMTKLMFRSFQRMCELNIQLVQTLLEESTSVGQRLLTADRPTDGLAAAAGCAQPITEKLRAYHQHVSRLAADTQVDLARVAEQHVQNTSRTARSLADEVARNAAEETERGLQAQQETVRRFADPFVRAGEGSASQSPSWTEQTGTTMQSSQAGASQQRLVHGDGGASAQH
jgi:phasin family protein